VCQPESMNEEFDFTALGAELAESIIAVIPDWVDRCVRRFLTDPNLELVRAAQHDAVAEVAAPLRALLSADIDDQRGTPLTVVRTAVQHPTQVLRVAGVEPLQRDPFAVRAFPDDLFELNPGNWSDIHESLAEPGLRWSVAKAYVHQQRHRAT
jgi:hypothetical protein